MVEPGWSLEGGGRYVGSWNIFHKDLGAFVTAPISPLSSVSRLTYDDMESNGGEFFGRIDTPWNLFVKGYIGGSRMNDGHLNDEDFGTVLFGAYVPYSNTLSPVVTGQTSYGVIDGGYDFLHGPGYKLDLFAGYFRFNETMKGYGCTPLANANCFAAVPITGDPIIAETDHWDALRTGIAGEMMITDRLKLSGEVAYLPYVTFKGVDDHYFANTGVIANINPEWGHGDGVQADVLASSLRHASIQHWYRRPVLGVMERESRVEPHLRCDRNSDADTTTELQSSRRASRGFRAGGLQVRKLNASQLELRTGVHSIALEIGDQRRAEVALGSLARVNGHVTAKHVELTRSQRCTVWCAGRRAT